MSPGAYCWIEKKIFEVIKEVVQSKCEEEILKQQTNEGSSTQPEYEDEGWALSGDNSWSKQRNASKSVYTMIDYRTKKVIHQIILEKKSICKINGKEVIINEGNYKGTSKRMKGKAF